MNRVDRCAPRLSISRSVENRSGLTIFTIFSLGTDRRVGDNLIASERALARWPAPPSVRLSRLTSGKNALGTSAFGCEIPELGP